PFSRSSTSRSWRVALVPSVRVTVLVSPTANSTVTCRIFAGAEGAGQLPLTAGPLPAAAVHDAAASLSPVAPPSPPPLSGLASTGVAASVLLPPPPVPEAAASSLTLGTSSSVVAPPQLSAAAKPKTNILLFISDFRPLMCTQPIIARASLLQQLLCHRHS